MFIFVPEDFPFLQFNCQNFMISAVFFINEKKMIDAPAINLRLTSNTRVFFTDEENIEQAIPNRISLTFRLIFDDRPKCERSGSSNSSETCRDSNRPDDVPGK